MSPQGYKNMDLESQDLIFNANLGQDENIIWTKKLRCSHFNILSASEVGHFDPNCNFLSRLKFDLCNFHFSTSTLAWLKYILQIYFISENLRIMS